jgi:hypothetical protein
MADHGAMIASGMGWLEVVYQWEGDRFGPKCVVEWVWLWACAERNAT